MHAPYPSPNGDNSNQHAGVTTLKKIIPKGPQLAVKCAYTKMVPLKELKPNPRNPNIHSKEQIEFFVKVLKYQGIRRPITISKLSGFVTRGHGLLEAIRECKTTSAPCDYQDYDSEEQEIADMIADNELARQSVTDRKLLEELAFELPKGFDLSLLAIPHFELPKLEGQGGTTGNCDEDEVPEPPKKVKAKRGDLFELGNHRVLCGDATDKKDVDRLMAGEKADMLCWDPPFNVGFGYEGEYKGQDNKSPEDYGKFLRSCIDNFQANAAKQHSVFIWQGITNLRHFEKWFSGNAWRLIAVGKNWIQARPTWIQYAWDPVIAWTSDITSRAHAGQRDWFASNTRPDPRFQDLDRNEAGNHPCPRPIDNVTYFVENWSRTNALIVDLSLGSGSTTIAAEKNGRKCYGIEIEPLYISVIIQRWQKFTGKQAYRIDGEGKKLAWDAIKVNS